jgi:hypothetical protein
MYKICTSCLGVVIWPNFQGPSSSKLKISLLIGTFQFSLLFDLEYSRYIHTKLRPDRTSDIAARWPSWKTYLDVSGCMSITLNNML